MTNKSDIAYEIGIKLITIHPKYSCKKASNDIAILELDNEIQWSESVSPACLPVSYGENGYQHFENTLATVAGWGWTNENSKNGKSLL